MITSYLERLCEELEMDIPQKREDDSYHLAITDEIMIKIIPQEKGFFAHAKIIPSPQGKEEDFYTYIMQANLLHQGTGGMTLGLDSEDNFLTISLKMPYEIKYEDFKNYIEDFVNYFLYWKEEAESAKWKTST